MYLIVGDQVWIYKNFEHVSLKTAQSLLAEAFDAARVSIYRDFMNNTVNDATVTEKFLQYFNNNLSNFSTGHASVGYPTNAPINPITKTLLPIFGLF